MYPYVRCKKNIINYLTSNAIYGVDKINKLYLALAENYKTFLAKANLIDCIIQRHTWRCYSKSDTYNFVKSTN